MPVDDPYDAQTPMLSFTDVQGYIAELPGEVLAVLALGPIEEAKRCRACQALDPILPVHPSEPLEAHDDVAIAAHHLKTWHDDLGRSSWMIERVEPRLFPGEIERVNAEEKHLFGSLQYARCCLLYALALDELAERRWKAEHDA